jgi:hypothetical protein
VTCRAGGLIDLLAARGIAAPRWQAFAVGGNGDGDHCDILLGRGLAELERVRIALCMHKAEREDARHRCRGTCPQNINPLNAHSSRAVWR